MVGKGRAPCCDKSKVKRGPWSPNEDLRLITFIQKYGHDNWRALPKLAGLLRCGKSCRLRWINYLRPDVKRGNFTKEEEENIIKLHQTLGNKWSKIASHFSGRTDNEIKNVWNTHLKKRSMLSSKNNDPSGDESNRKSSITTTSSSSSSISSSLSTRKRDTREVLIEEESDPKRVCDENELIIRHEKINQSDDDVEKQVMDKEINPQLAKYPKEQVMISSTTSSNSSYGSNVSSGNMILMELPNLEEDFSMDHTLLFDFKEPCVSDFFCEVNKPNNIDEKAVLLDQTTTLMPLEAEFGSDFWDMLNSFDTSIFQPNDNIGEVQVVENSEPCHNSTFLEKQNLEIDEKKKWFNYLESKLELEGTTMEINEDQNQVEQLDQTHAFEEITVPEINFSNEITVTPEADPICLDFSPSTYDLWDY